MEADNDAGAVSTYIQAGAQYGTHLLWLLVLLLPISYFVQEMVVRLGIATGQGHAAMVYRRFGKWWGRFSLADLLVLNFLTLVTEFAAIALALDKLGVNPVYGVPAASIGLTALVLTGSYLRWERIVVFLCLVRYCVPRSSGRGRCAAAYPAAFDSGQRTDRQLGISGDRHSGNDHRALAVVLSAELRRR
jgi:Mn2+/Fe2+ NRAMP family transporter